MPLFACPAAARLSCSGPGTPQECYSVTVDKSPKVGAAVLTSGRLVAGLVLVQVVHAAHAQHAQEAVKVDLVRVCVWQRQQTVRTRSAREAADSCVMLQTCCGRGSRSLAHSAVAVCVLTLSQQAA